MTNQYDDDTNQTNQLRNDLFLQEGEFVSADYYMYTNVSSILSKMAKMGEIICIGVRETPYGKPVKVYRVASLKIRKKNVVFNSSNTGLSDLTVLPDFSSYKLTVIEHRKL